VPTTSTITLGSTNSVSNSSLAGIFLTDNLSFNPVGTTNFLAAGPGAASTVTGFSTSVALANSSGATAHFNRIISGTTAIDNPNNQTSNLENNWWGCNAGPG